MRTKHLTKRHEGCLNTRRARESIA
jgi:hypothetical protein